MGVEKIKNILQNENIKKYSIIIFVLALAIIVLFVAKNNEGLNIFDKIADKNPDKTSQVQEDIPAPTCSDGIQNQGERHADCGGPCEACPPDCSDGIQNQDEEKVDCGGTICGACPTCTDGIQNQGERRVDCGGPCEPCPPDCYDGIQNQDEEKVDCGGTICAACPTCTDGIQNQGECQVDCGGPCAACPLITALTPEELSKVKEAILSSVFISDLPKEGVISLHFFNSQCGERIELDTLLIGKDQILTSGTPDLTILLHSKYIAELTPTNLCEIIPRANTNGDLGVETTMGEAALLFKYSGIVKHRACFGF